MGKLGQFLQKFALDYVVKYLKNNKADVIKTAKLAVLQGGKFDFN